LERGVSVTIEEDYQYLLKRTFKGPGEINFEMQIKRLQQNMTTLWDECGLKLPYPISPMDIP
jgi:hypothetical protein